VPADSIAENSVTRNMALDASDSIPSKKRASKRLIVDSSILCARRLRKGGMPNKSYCMVFSNSKSIFFFNCENCSNSTGGNAVASDLSASDDI